ncbi:MAG TPA: hypothetical protein VG758_08550 [Hyphomicrobiaceae bacterium]|jgi:hypothetical protein|nr:hypothetical protein [Hyphomicrobiaceae bacterium]
MLHPGTFIDVLHSDRPATGRADKLALYGFLVGSWESTVIAHEESGATHTNRGEIHAGWVLEGRALQDVWMLPRRAERRPDAPPRQLPVTGNWYGTTLRVYDPGIDAWHILWNNPLTQLYTRQVGRACGADIVQEGRHESGALMRWSFTKIKPESFHWLAEVSADGGASWRLQVEVLARR